MKIFWQMLIYNILHRIASWRWVAIPVIFGIVGAYSASWTSFDYDKQEKRAANVWDVAAATLSNQFILGWIYVLGFALLIGDSFLQERERGLLALSLSRVKSRQMWWVTKIFSVGIIAFCYVAIALISILAVSSLSLPFSLESSPASRTENYLSNATWYPVLANVNLSTPLLVLFGGLCTAIGLWVVGSLVITCSIFYQKIATPLVITLAWLVLSLFLPKSVYVSMPYLALLDVRFFITYGKHSPQISNMAFPAFLLVVIAVVSMIVLVGGHRVKKLDL